MDDKTIPDKSALDAGITLQSMKTLAGNNQDVKTKSRNDIAWDAMYRRLVIFFQTKGHCNVSRTDPKDPGLGRWVIHQRHEYKQLQAGRKSTMTQYRIDKLTELDFQFSALVNHPGWEAMYKQLQTFRKENGHCNVSFRDEKWPRLGRWVSTQRKEYKSYEAGGKSTMSEYRANKLKELKFCFVVRDNEWNEMYQQLHRFQKENGHTNVLEMDMKLGNWLRLQRTEFQHFNNGMQTTMTSDRIEKLRRLDLSFAADQENKQDEFDCCDSASLSPLECHETIDDCGLYDQDVDRTPNADCS